MSTFILKRKYFSENEKKKRKVYIDEIDGDAGRFLSTAGGIASGLAIENATGAASSGKHLVSNGYGRSALYHGLASSIGGYIGKREAEAADREGKSDGQIKHIALTRGGEAGAVLGGLAGVGLASVHTRQVNPLIIVKSAGLGATMGGISAGAGAYRNTRKKLNKRKKLEEGMN